MASLGNAGSVQLTVGASTYDVGRIDVETTDQSSGSFASGLSIGVQARIVLDPEFVRWVNAQPQGQRP